MNPFELINVKLARSESGGEVIHHYSRNDATAFFGVQISHFVKTSKQTFNCRLACDDVCRVRFLEDINDEQLYEGNQWI